MKIKKLEKIKQDFKNLEHPNSHILKHPYRLNLIGSSGSGKTNLLGNIVLSENLFRNYYTKIVIISPNYLTDTAYENIEDYGEKLEKNHKFELIAFTSFDENEMMEILEEIKKDLEEGKEKYKNSKSTNKEKYIPRVLIILDDIIDDTKLLNSKFLKLLFTRGRHLNISTIIASQGYMNIPKIVRLNCTNTIFFKPRNKKEIEALYDEIIKGWKKEDFFKMTNEIFNEPFQFINVNLTTPSKKKHLMLNFDGYIE